MLVEKVEPDRERPGSILVATLGGQPQIVTFALDALLARTIPIHEAIILHPAAKNDRLEAALEQLQKEFTGSHYAGRTLRLHFQPLGSASDDQWEEMSDDASVEAALKTILVLFSSLKADHHSIHACISGGRRLMALLVLSAAMLHFDHRDALWHVSTPASMRERADEGALMHATPEDGVRLVRVPLAPWGAYFSVLREATVESLQKLYLHQMDSQQRDRCAQVISQLTPRQSDVLRAIAEGLTPQEIAERLSITLAAVDAHKLVIFRQCRLAWGYPFKHPLTYHFLREQFREYLALHPDPPKYTRPPGKKTYKKPLPKNSRNL
jgi:CRISPR-associated protein Csx14